MLFFRLNDEIINFVMKMLQDLDEEICKLDTSRKSSHFFSSFFVSQLLQLQDMKGNRGKYNYAAVKR
jgi:Ulp1 family protease